MQVLKADTAVKVVIGPAVDPSDGVTPVTTLAVSTADEAEIMKHDAAAVTDISSNTFAAIASMDGYYNLTITAGQLDTEGMLTVAINDDDVCLPILARFMVVNANVYDSLYAAATTDYLQVDIEQVDGDSTAAANLNSACDNYSATRGLSGTALPAAAADGAGGLPISDAGGLDLDTQLAHLDADVSSIADTIPQVLVATTIATLASQTSFTLTAGSADDNAYVGATIVVKDQSTATQKAVGLCSAYTGATKTVTLVADPGVFTMATGDSVYVFASTKSLPAALPDGAGGLPISDAGGLDVDTMDSNVSAILTDTAEIGAAGAGLTEAGGDGDHLTEAGGTGDHLTAVPWNAAWDAEVQSEVNDGLVALGLDHLLAAAIVGADVTDNSALAKIVSKSATADWDDFVNTTDSLQAIADAVGGISGSNAYFVTGGANQDTDGDLEWMAVGYNNGAIQTGASNCVVQLVSCDGDGTITNVAGATETVASPDANGVFNGTLSALSVPTAGQQYYMLATITIDGSGRPGVFEVKSPVRTA